MATAPGVRQRPWTVRFRPGNHSGFVHVADVRNRFNGVHSYRTGVTACVDRGADVRLSDRRLRSPASERPDRGPWRRLAPPAGRLARPGPGTGRAGERPAAARRAD